MGYGGKNRTCLDYQSDNSILHHILVLFASFVETFLRVELVVVNMSLEHMSIDEKMEITLVPPSKRLKKVENSSMDDESIDDDYSSHRHSSEDGGNDERRRSDRFDGKDGSNRMKRIERNLEDDDKSYESYLEKVIKNSEAIVAHHQQTSASNSTTSYSNYSYNNYTLNYHGTNNTPANLSIGQPNQQQHPLATQVSEMVTKLAEREVQNDSLHSSMSLYEILRMWHLTNNELCLMNTPIKNSNYTTMILSNSSNNLRKQNKTEPEFDGESLEYSTFGVNRFLSNQQMKPLLQRFPKYIVDAMVAKLNREKWSEILESEMLQRREAGRVLNDATHEFNIAVAKSLRGREAQDRLTETVQKFSDKIRTSNLRYILPMPLPRSSFNCVAWWEWCEQITYVLRDQYMNSHWKLLKDSQKSFYQKYVIEKPEFDDSGQLKTTPEDTCASLDDLIDILRESPLQTFELNKINSQNQSLNRSQSGVSSDVETTQYTIPTDTRHLTVTKINLDDNGVSSSASTTTQITNMESTPSGVTPVVASASATTSPSLPPNNSQKSSGHLSSSSFALKYTINPPPSNHLSNEAKHCRYMNDPKAKEILFEMKALSLLSRGLWADYMERQDMRWLGSQHVLQEMFNEQQQKLRYLERVNYTLEDSLEYAADTAHKKIKRPIPTVLFKRHNIPKTIRRQSNYPTQPGGNYNQQQYRYKNNMNTTIVKLKLKPNNSENIKLENC
ncbi:hypothetical protein SNEBB_009800 [Seison nebaliae]|nr:hypothetical protein SNEBB_009800 [Seison nebaliae]